MNRTMSATERGLAAATRGIAAALLLAVAGLLALVGLAGPASATSSYPPAPSCSVAGSSTGSGSSITGTGFQPGSSVTVSLGGSHTTVVTNSAGSFATSLGSASGQLTATGIGCTATASVSALSSDTSNTVPASKQSGGALPNTGANVLGVAAVAGLMLVGGVLLLLQGRRRHS